MSKKVEKMLSTSNAGMLSGEDLESGVIRAVPGNLTGAMLDKKSGVKKSKKSAKSKKVEK